MKEAKGYKQTEVGLIPEDWEVLSLGEIFDFKNGLNKEKEYFGYGTPIINYMDVFNNRGLNSVDITGKVSLSKQEIKNYEAKAGDVFFTRTSETTNEIGISSVMLEDIEDAVFSGFVLRARPKNDKLNNLFKKYCFSTFGIRKEIISKSTYTTRALTNGKSLSNVKVAVPPQKEQHAIGSALTETDLLLSSIQKLIAKKRSIKQSVMQELLTGKKRLKGFNAEWKTKKLGEIVVIRKGEQINKSLLSSEDVFAVINGGIEPSGFMSKWNRNESTITISEGGNSCGFVNFMTKKFWAGGHCYTFHNISNDIDGLYLFQLLKFREKSIMELRVGSGLPNIQKKRLNDFSILIPPFNEQQTISKILIDISGEIEILQQQLSKYTLLKQGMLQNLLTGAIRLT